MSAEDLIEYWEENAAGKECWCVSAGGCTGSAFILRYGSKVQRKKTISNTMLSMDCRMFDSEFSLFVESAKWMLGTDHNGQGDLITDSNDDCMPNGPMVQGLESLVGNTISHAHFNPVTCDLDIYFLENSVRLKVFGRIPRGSSGYSLYSPNYIISIKEDQQIEVFTRS